jgi:fumarate reductase subunit C
MKSYVRPISPMWWTTRKSYVLFMIRELTSVFVAIYVVLFLVMIHRVSQGPEAYGAFLEGLRTPGAVLFHIVALAFALFHTITWFNLTPKAIALWDGEKRVPPELIIAPNYVAWVVVSMLIAWLVLRS